MQPQLENLAVGAVLASLILVTGMLYLFFSNRVRKVYARIFPQEPKHFWSFRAPTIAAIRFVGGLMSMTGIALFAGVLYWATQL